MPKNAQFGEFLKTWSLRSNSVTRQVNFNRKKIGGNCQNWKFQMRHFGCAPWSEFQGVPYYLLSFYAIYRWITAPELLQQLKVCPKMILALSLSGTTLPRRKREESDRWKWKTHFGIVQKEKIYWSLMIRLNWISKFASSSSLLKKSILLTFFNFLRR